MNRIMKWSMFFVFTVFLAGCDLLNSETSLSPVIESLESYEIEVFDDSFDLAEMISIQDDTDGEILVHSSMIDYRDFDVNVVGEYIVLVRVTNSRGAAVSKEITLKVVDTVAPVVELIGGDTIIINIGDEFVDPGVHVEDNYETTYNIVTSSNVDSSVPGVYEVKYIVSDNSGNQANEVIRKVYVIERAPDINITNVVPTTTSISFKLDFIDPDEIGVIEKIELVQGESAVQTLSDTTITEFTGLNSDTSYSIRVTYSYQLSNGEDRIIETVFAWVDQMEEIDDSCTTVEYIEDVFDIEEETCIYGTVTAFSNIETQNIFILDDTLQVSDITGEENIDLEVGDIVSIRYINTMDGIYNGVINYYGMEIHEVISTNQIRTVAMETFDVDVDIVDYTDTSIMFNIVVDDPENVSYLSSVELFIGNLLVETLTDVTSSEFSGLLSNNEYKIVATYKYDLNDGLGEQEMKFESFVTTLARQLPSLSIVNPLSEKDKIIFDVSVSNIDTFGGLKSIELYKGDTLVESLSDLTVREFNGLLSDTLYTIIVTGTYDLNEGFGEKDISFSQSIETMKLQTPTLSFIDVTSTKDSISFDLTIQDFDNTGYVSSIELYQEDTLIETLPDLTIREFTNLNSNSTYEIKISYLYDLNDGLGFRLYQESVSTYNSICDYRDLVVREGYVFGYVSDNIGESFTISFNECSIQAGSDTYPNIFSPQNGDLVKLNVLETNVNATYGYSYIIFEDGSAEVINVVPSLVDYYVPYKEITTQPEDIIFSSSNILNTVIYKEDIVLIEFDVQNPDQVDAKSIYINDEWVDLSMGSSPTKLKVQISAPNVESTHAYSVQKLKLESGVEIELNQEYLFTITVTPKYEVINVTQVDGNLYSTQFDTYTITFSHPIANDINRVVVNGTNPVVQIVELNNISVIDEYSISVPISSIGNVSNRNFKIVSIDYVKDSNTSVIPLDYDFVRYVVTNNVSYINTVDDLLTMVGDYRVYILQNDLDFTGVTWSPINLQGVLLGNGYSINNLSIIDYSYSDSSHSNYSLFDTISGVVQDLTISNMTISSGRGGSVKAATLAIRNNGIISNVTISGSIDVSTSDTTELGGMVVDNSGLIIDSSIDVTISNFSKTAFIGGVTAVNSSGNEIHKTDVKTTIFSSSDVGYSNHKVGGVVGYNQGNIYEVKSEADVSVESSFIYSGGITGYNLGIIENAFSTGDMSGSLISDYKWGYQAGFVGFNSDTGIIRNSYTTSNCILDEYSITWSGGFVGENQGEIHNSFSDSTGFKQSFVKTQSGLLEGNLAINTGTSLSGLENATSSEEINTTIESLWDTSIWDFDSIDNVNVLYPILIR